MDNSITIYVEISHESFHEFVMSFMIFKLKFISSRGVSFLQPGNVMVTYMVATEENDFLYTADEKGL